jgi:hypothetical protein
MEEYGIMNKIVDFNKCRVGHRHYLGAETKLSLIYNDKHYMVKFPKSLKEKQNDLNSSYANNVFSEYIAVVDQTPMLSETRQDFLKIMLEKRYEKIIAPAYERAMMSRVSE